MNDKVDRMLPYEELTRIFNHWDTDFVNHFIGHTNGDEDLINIDPTMFTKRTNAFIKFLAPPSYKHVSNS